MFIYEMSLKIKNNKKDQITDNLWLLAADLFHNGQILKGVDFITENNKNFIITVICPEIDSLDTRYASQSVNSSLDKLYEISNDKLKIKLIGRDIETKEDRGCSCDPKYYILFTHLFKIRSPINCGNCFRSIPLYKILKNISNDILFWEQNYKACDELQIGCRVGEKFGSNEMQNFNSNLTKYSLEVCQKIEEVTRKPVFYYLFNYRNISHKKDVNRKCPSCNGEWILDKQLHNLFDFKCDKCKLLSSFTCN